MRTTKTAIWVAVTTGLMACASAPTQTQQSNQPPNSKGSLTAASLRGAIVGGCEEAVKNILADFDKQLNFVDPARFRISTCQCTVERLMADARIHDAIARWDSANDTLRNSANFKQYMMGRGMATAMQCLGEQLNEETSKAKLAF